MKQNHQKSTDDLRQITYALQKENISLRAHMTKVKEDTESRKRNLKKQLEHMKDRVQDKSPCTPLCHSSAHIPTADSQFSTPIPSPQAQPLNPTPIPDPSALTRDDPPPWTPSLSGHSQSSPTPLCQTTTESQSSSNRTILHTQNLTSYTTYSGHIDGPQTTLSNT